MRNKKYNIKSISAMLLLYICVLFSGCHSNGNASELDAQSEEPTKAIVETTEAAGMDEETGDSVLDEETGATDADFTEDKQKETVALETKEDIDNNGIMDTVQTIHRNDGSESLIRIFLNGEQIFEYEDANLRIMGVDAFEYLDLDGDDKNEIFVTADTNANSRPLTDVLCLKETDGQWNRMDIPLNETGNNGFSFEITRGKDEFDFIISSDDLEQKIHFDATDFFVDDEGGNIDSIQAYRKNNYKEGDKVGFISGWGIWEARTGTYEGCNCIIALQGIEGPYGHGLGQINIYFAYNEQGEVDIMKVEYQP